MIPMVDLKQQYVRLKQEIDQNIQAVLDECHFVLGPNVASFEKEVAEYLGVKHSIGVASGTDALQIALDATGVCAGDEVITSPFTFIATAEAIRYLGAKPVFVDIDPKTFNFDIDAVEGVITEKTAAIMPVHLFGQPIDMRRLASICKKHSLKLIEDCAQSFGASVAGFQTGSVGDAAGFSFFPSKNLGCFGDGGLVTTQSDEIAENVRSLRNHGSKVRYHHDRIGYNSRLDELQAVILRVKLKQIDEYNSNRRRVAHLYSSLLSELPVTTPYEDSIGVHVYHQYTILSDRRDKIMSALNEAGIASAIYYPIPLHRQEVFAADYHTISFPIAENISNLCLSLPIYPELKNEQVHEIVAALESAF